MKKTGAALIAAVLMLATAASAQGLKIGYINLQRIERESDAARRATEVLRQEFEPRNQQIAELQKKISDEQSRLNQEKDQLSADEARTRARALTDMMRQSDQMVMRLGEEVEQRKAELGSRIVEEARTAIKAIAEAGKFDLIVQEAAYARSGIDITDEVLKEMAKRGGR